MASARRSNAARLRPSGPAQSAILVYACLAMLGLQAIHGIDHLFIQGRALPVPIALLGVLESLAVGFALLLALRGDRRAPLAVALAGAFIAVAFAGAHLAPDWGLLSDPYNQASLGGFSWGVMLVGLGAALTFGLVGLSLWLGNRSASSPGDGVPRQSALP